MNGQIIIFSYVYAANVQSPDKASTALSFNKTGVSNRIYNIDKGCLVFGELRSVTEIFR